MRLKILVALIAIGAAFSWQAEAQTGKAPSPYWVVNGRVYDINKSPLWTQFDGTILKFLTNGLVVETFTVETKQQAVVVRRLNQNYGNSTRYHDEANLVDVGTEKVRGRKMIIRNYPIEENPAVGKTIGFIAMQTGTSDYNGDKLELWDLGTTPTEDDFKKLKADIEERQRAAQKELDEKRRVAAAKADAAKKVIQDRVFKSNLDQAAKGDAYGLLRMGERYRDGDGVEKDLAKAKDYLTKAVAAGSPTAADELSKLNRGSTNSPATQ